MGKGIHINTYQFLVPIDTPFDAQQASHVVKSLLALGRSIALQIVARKRGIEWRLLDLSGQRHRLDTLHTPNISVKHHSLSLLNHYPVYRARVVYTTYARALLPLLYLTDTKARSDPLLQMVQHMSMLQEHEAVRYTVIIHQLKKPQIYKTLGTLDAMTELFRDPAQYPRTFDLVVEHKQNRPWYECLVGLEIDTPNPKRAISLRQTIDIHLNSSFDRTQANHPFNGLRSLNYAPLVTVSNRQKDFQSRLTEWYIRRRQKEAIAEWLQDHYLYLEADEIAALWHLPHEAFETCNVIWQKQAPAMSHMMADNKEGIIIGSALYQQMLHHVHLLDWDRLTHTNILGRNGVGKSTLMYHMIEQDIRANKVVIVIDPHGNLVNQILQHLPEGHEDRVVYYALSDDEHPLPLNVFAGSGSYGSIGRVVDAIQRIHTTTGVRMDYYIRAGIQVMQVLENATMQDMYYLFVDRPFRNRLLPHVAQSDVVHTFTHEYNQLSPGKQRDIHSPILSRISPFYDNPHLKASLCHPKSINIRQHIQDHKVVLISLDANAEKIPQNLRNLVGELLISEIQMVAMTDDRLEQPAYLYVDEVQNFITSPLDVLFAEARKYGVHMTVAHQFLSQLPVLTMDSMLGNVGTTMAFRSSTKDARALADHMAPQFDAAQLVNLNRFQAAVKTQLRGDTQDAFLLQIELPPEETAASLARAEAIKATSLKNHPRMTRDEVLDYLDNRQPKIRGVVDSLSTLLSDEQNKSNDGHKNDDTTDDDDAGIDYRQFTED